MKKTIILIVLSHVLAFACMGQSSNERILKELDEVIGKKKEHCEERERTIAQLKQRLANEYDNAQRYTICSELFTQYLHYQRIPPCIMSMRWNGMSVRQSHRERKPT